MKVLKYLGRLLKLSKNSSKNNDKQVSVKNEEQKLSIGLIENAIYQSDLDSFKKLIKKFGLQKILINNNDELSALHLACSVGNHEIVDYLLSTEISVDANIKRINNFVPLHSAAMNGHTVICSELIEKGANVYIQTIPQGYAPIHSAAFGGHLETIKLLVDKGANINLKNYRDEYPIDTAKRQGQKHVIEYFDSLIK